MTVYTSSNIYTFIVKIPNINTTQFIIYHTIDPITNMERMWFTRKCPSESLSEHSPSLLDVWTDRPFDFSSASHLDVTEAVCDIMLSMKLATDPTCSTGKRWALLDPCCGSGTVLMSALRFGLIDLFQLYA